MDGSRGPLDQPLVWDRPPSGPHPSPPPPRVRPAPPAPRWGRLRLWVATLADLGVVLLALTATWGVAASLGAALDPFQLAIAGVAGLLLAAVIGVGSFWGWRASPGMALLRLRVEAPLSLGQAVRAWVGWLPALLLAGVPLQFGRSGRTVAERLAGSGLTLQAPGGSA